MKQKTINKNRVEPVQAAKIRWQDDTAYSEVFDDIYFSTDNGIEETRYVFLQQNDLPAAWQQQSDFTILETGFGTGLNFFCVLDQWLQTAADTARLHYVSVEKYPLTKTDFEKLATVWPQYKDCIDEIVFQYPPLVTGFHQLRLFGGRVSLLLLLGDALTQLSQLQCKADACFLDGFSPSKNQSMWSAKLFQQLARLMKPGGTISTFTAVGDVRRGLQQAGFEMQKVDAFGQKRHMLSGKYKGDDISGRSAPWFHHPISPQEGRHAVVIGAGISGLSTAISLLKAGWQVTVIEKSDKVASGASGNPAGVVMPRLDKQQSADAVFYWQAFYCALNSLREFERQGIDCGLTASGVLQLENSLDEQDWPAEFLTAIDRQQAQQKAGIAVKHAARWLPQAIFIEPALLCRNLYQTFKNKIQFEFNSEITALQRNAERWSLITNQAVINADVVVICNAEAANQFEQTSFLPVQPVRGQISWIKQPDFSKRLKAVICDRGYLIPAGDKLVLGASFDRDDTDTQLRMSDHEENLARVNAGLDDAEQLSADNDQVWHGRASVRAMSPDRMPLAGAVPNVEFYQQHYHDLARGRAPDRYPAARYQPGLYINACHGSRGLTSSFLSADILLALIKQTPIPVSTEVLQRLHPGRFQIRQLLRN